MEKKTQEEIELNYRTVLSKAPINAKGLRIIFLQGCLAYHDKKPLRHNPYDLGSREHEEWRKGWENEEIREIRLKDF